MLFGNAPRGTILPDNIQKKKDPRRNEGRFENSNHRFYYYGKIDIVKEEVGVSNLTFT